MYESDFFFLMCRMMIADEYKSKILFQELHTNPTFTDKQWCH